MYGWHVTGTFIVECGWLPSDVVLVVLVVDEKALRELRDFRASQGLTPKEHLRRIVQGGHAAIYANVKPEGGKP